jgi:L-ascorbate metabolism protein UlaG (beta-lactamase superfamily)
VAFKVGPRLFLDTAARSPQQPLGPFLTDPRAYQTAPESGLRITWFGHSSSLVEIDGVSVLIDPVWDERAAPTSWAGPKRFFPPTIPLRDLPPIDAILISHDHFDHLGAATVRALARIETQKHTRWIAPLGVGAILTSFGVDSARITELNWTEQTTIGNLTLTALPSRHFSGRSLFNRFETLWASFALIGPNHRVYFGGDSGEWDGFHEIGEAFGPFDLTMLEIGAYDPLWSDIHMGPEGAVRSFHALGGHGLLMPIHWGLFDLALHPWSQPIEYVTAVENLKLWSPTPGVPTDVVRGGQIRSDWWR